MYRPIDQYPFVPAWIRDTHCNTRLAPDRSHLLRQQPPLTEQQGFRILD